MQILPGDLDDPLIAALLGVHLARALAVTPRASVHALDISALKAPGIAFWAAWDGAALLGVGALQHLSAKHGEVKSMHTAEHARRRGVASAMLHHIIREARAKGHSRLSLETGAMPYFEPARAFYRGLGFSDCGPFGIYAPDPNSVFMTLAI